MLRDNDSKLKRNEERDITSVSKIKHRVPSLADIMKLVRQSPLLLSESKSQYAKMLRRLVADLKCSDYMEVLLVKDVVDETWTIIRLRKASIGTINGRANRLRTMKAHRLKRQRNEEEKQELMAEVGKDMKHEETRAAAFTEMSEWIATSINREKDHEQELYEANALEGSIDYQLKINLLIDAAMKRRNDALKQLEWYRKALAAELRAATDMAIEAADCDDVPLVP